MAQPALALSLVQELGLAPAVYAPPEHVIPSPPDGGYDWALGAAVARAASRVLALRAGKTHVPCAGVEEAPTGRSLAPTTREGASGQPAAAGEGCKKTSEAETVTEATATAAVADEPGEMQKDGGSDGVGGVGKTGEVGEATTDGKGLKDDPLPATASAAAETATVASATAAMTAGDCGEAVGVKPAAESEVPTSARARPEGTGKGKAKAVAKAAAKGEAESGVKVGSNHGKDGDDLRTLVRELFLSAALFPLVEVKHKLKKGKLAPAAQSVVQESLKVCVCVHCIVMMRFFVYRFFFLRVIAPAVAYWLTLLYNSHENIEI